MPSQEDLVEFLVKALVEKPDEVSVEGFDEGDDIVIEVHVAQEDLGRVIGRRGRVVNAVRAVAKASGAREDRRVVIDVVE